MKVWKVRPNLWESALMITFTNRWSLAGCPLESRRCWPAPSGGNPHDKGVHVESWIRHPFVLQRGREHPELDKTKGPDLESGCAWIPATYKEKWTHEKFCLPPALVRDPGPIVARTWGKSLSSSNGTDNDGQNRKDTMKLSLTSRIVISFVLLPGVLLVTVGVLSYRSGRESLKNAAMDEMSSDAIEKEAQIDAWIKEREGDLRQLSSQNDVVNESATLIAAAPASAKARSAHLHLMHEFNPTLASYNSAYIEIYVMEPEGGKVVASTSPAEEGKSKLGHVYFTKGKTDFYLQMPYVSADFKVPLMTEAIPLRAAN